jgi:hypothetical protein
MLEMSPPARRQRIYLLLITPIVEPESRLSHRPRKLGRDSSMCLGSEKPVSDFDHEIM